MESDARTFTALIARWDEGWEAFILDDLVGLLGMVSTEHRKDLHGAVRTFLADLVGSPDVGFRVEIVAE